MVKEGPESEANPSAGNQCELQPEQGDKNSDNRDNTSYGDAGSPAPGKRDSRPQGKGVLKVGATGTGSAVAHKLKKKASLGKVVVGKLLGA